MIFQNTLEFAKTLDQQDSISKYRNEFIFPQHNGKNVIYFTGNSLGLQPKSAKKYVDDVMNDWANLAVEGWYQDPHHPYVEAVGKILDAISIMPHIIRLEFLVANGQDPLTGLQMQLDRQSHPKSQLPSSLSSQLKLQSIYSFS